MWPVVRVQHLHTDVPCTNPTVDHRQYCFTVLNPARIVNSQLIASLLVGCLNFVIFISIVSLYTHRLTSSQPKCVHKTSSINKILYILT